MRVGALLLLLCASTVSATTYSETLNSKAKVSPVQKVIQMLEDMLTKSKQEKQDEEVRFAAFKQFCAGSAAEKTRSIEEADSAIGKITGEIEDLSLEVDQLGADIQKADSDVEQLSKKIGALATEINNFDTICFEKVRNQGRSFRPINPKCVVDPSHALSDRHTVSNASTNAS